MMKTQVLCELVLGARGEINAPRVQTQLYTIILVRDLYLKPSDGEAVLAKRGAAVEVTADPEIPYRPRLSLPDDRMILYMHEYRRHVLSKPTPRSSCLVGCR